MKDEMKEKTNSSASPVDALVITPKFIPVILGEDATYIKSVNEEATEALQIMYETQIFPNINNYIVTPGWDPELIKGRDFVLHRDYPMVYLLTAFYSKEDEERDIYEKLMDEKYKGEEFDSEKDEDYLNRVSENILDYHNRSEIYKRQREILGL